MPLARKPPRRIPLIFLPGSASFADVVALAVGPRAFSGPQEIPVEPVERRMRSVPTLDAFRRHGLGNARIDPCRVVDHLAGAGIARARIALGDAPAGALMTTGAF